MKYKNIIKNTIAVLLYITVVGFISVLCAIAILKHFR